MLKVNTNQWASAETAFAITSLTKKPGFTLLQKDKIILADVPKVELFIVELWLNQWFTVIGTMQNFAWSLKFEFGWMQMFKVNQNKWLQKAEKIELIQYLCE
jgi:hypothetical protein